MIEVKHLTRRYGSTVAVDDVSFVVESGAICGLLGPNGAGKSTTMNIMTGCLAATDGEVRYDGLEIYADKDKVKPRLGYLPEQPPLYDEMTVWEYLEFVGRAKGLSHLEVGEEAKRVSFACGLGDVIGRLIKNLSKGYKQRVGIAQALMGDPDIIILDEPTVGLDPIQIIEIRDLVKRLGECHTVIVSSHILSEIRALCDHIVIISKGRVVANDTPENLEQLFAGSSATIATVQASENTALSIISALPHIDTISCSPTAEEGIIDVRIEVVNDADIRGDVSRAFAEHGVPLLRMVTSRASLEDVFIELATAVSEEVETSC